MGPMLAVFAAAAAAAVSGEGEGSAGQAEPTGQDTEGDRPGVKPGERRAGNGSWSDRNGMCHKHSMQSTRAPEYAFHAL